jgi:hypothetical protein
MSFLRIRSKLTATALVSTLAIVPVAAGVVAVTLPARAQTDTAPPSPPPPPPGPKEGPKAEHHGDRMGGDMNRDRAGDHHGWRECRSADGHHRNHAMRLAKQLAGVETAIGIRSDQLDAWRRFTSLLVAFASPQWPDMAMTGPDDEDADGDPAMAPDAATSDEDTGDDDAAMAPAPSGDTTGTKPDTGSSSFGPLGFMVDRAIERGDKAKELKDAMAKLDAVLTPEQKQAARMLMRHHRRGMSGHGHWGDHGSWGGGDDRRDARDWRGGDRR